MAKAKHDEPIDLSAMYADAASDPIDIKGGDGAELMRQLEDAGLMHNGVALYADSEAVVQKETIDGATMSATFQIVTRNKGRNRNGNMVQIKETKFGRGMMIEEHKRNPVVFFNHGFPDPNPIGISRDAKNGRHLVKKQARRMMATVNFNGLTETSEQTFAMVDADQIKMASIGYIPILAMRLSEDDLVNSDEPGVENFERWRGGWDFVESEMVEWSITPIGADRDSIRQFIDRGSYNDVRFRGDFLRVMKAAAAPKPTIGCGLILQPVADSVAPAGDDGADLIVVTRGGTEFTGRADEIVKVIQALDRPAANQPAVDTDPQTANQPAPAAVTVEQAVSFDEIANEFERQRDAAALDDVALAGIIRDAVAEEIRPLTQGQDGMLNRIDGIEQRAAYATGAF